MKSMMCRRVKKKFESTKKKWDLLAIQIFTSLGKEIKKIVYLENTLIFWGWGE